MINDIDAAWCYKHLPLALGIGLWLRSCEKMAYPTCTSSLAQTPFCSQILSSTSTQTQYCTSSKFSWSPSTRLWKSLQKKKLSCQPSTIPTIPTRLLSSQGCLQFAGAYISPTSEKKLSSKLHPLQFDTWPVTHAPSDLPMMNRSLKAFLKPWSRGTFGISFEIEKPTFWKSFKKKVNLSKNTSFKQLYSCNSSKSRLKHG